MRGLACNHAFEDGNKRCALIAGRLMYARNNHLLNAPDVDLLHLVIDLIVEKWEVEKIAERLEMWAVPFSELDFPADS